MHIYMYSYIRACIYISYNYRGYPEYASTRVSSIVEVTVADPRTDLRVALAAQRGGSRDDLMGVGVSTPPS